MGALTYYVIIFFFVFLPKACLRRDYKKRKIGEHVPNINLGTSKIEGGGHIFSQMSELKVALRHHPK